MNRAPGTQRSPTASEQVATSKDPDPTRERLLDATEKLIFERGLASTTALDVALGAGVSEDVFHAHFADMTAAVRALGERHITLMRHGLCPTATSRSRSTCARRSLTSGSSWETRGRASRSPATSSSPKRPGQ